jgi:hypothetical protein
MKSFSFVGTLLMTSSIEIVLLDVARALEPREIRFPSDHWPKA